MFGQSSLKQDAPFQPDRIQSGVARLDFILQGGFIRGSAYSLLGAPGTGKTILANQIAFNHIRLEHGRVLYLTLLSESNSAMAHNLRTLRFYDEKEIGKSIFYLSGYQTLEQDGLDGLRRMIECAMRERETKLLIIDSIDAARESVEGERHYKKFLQSLQAFSRLCECTLIMLSYRDNLSTRGENTSVDGVLELTNSFSGPRAYRELTVHKFRATNFLAGKHEVEITEHGMQIHPRTEVHFDQPPDSANEDREKMPFGIEKLDEMMQGGVLSGSATALVGAPGSGKTYFGLSFLVEGARRGQHGTYFGFFEPPPRLLERADKLGLPLRKHVDSGMIDLLWQPPLEKYLDSLAEQLLERLRSEQDGRARRRLFIDGIEGFRAAAVYPDRMKSFLFAFYNQLRLLDVTTVMSEETDILDDKPHLPNPQLTTVVESVILLRTLEFEDGVHRLLSIVKMRESAHDRTVREFQISPQGVEIFPQKEGARQRVPSIKRGEL